MKLQKSIIAIIALFIFALTASGQGQYRRALDFSGDGKADITVLRRPVIGDSLIWITENMDFTYNQTLWGSKLHNVDRAVPGDYDGDTKGDYAIVRRGTPNLEWWIKSSVNGSYYSVPFGRSNFDEPIPGDYDGDQKADIAVKRGTGGLGYDIFYVLRSFDGQYDVITVNTPPNASACHATQGNFDGDFKADPTMYCIGSDAGNPGYFVWRRSTDGVQTVVRWGAGSDKPIFGDFDGDGITDLAIVRELQEPGTPYEWWIKGSTGVTYAIRFGMQQGTDSNHIIAQADYDGDGKTDIAVYDTVRGLYWIRQSSNSQVKVVKFGGFQTGGDNPAAGHRDAPIRLINNTFGNAD